MSDLAASLPASRAGDLLDRAAGLLDDPVLVLEAMTAAAELRDDPPDMAVLHRLAHAHGLSPFACDLVLLAGLVDEAAAATAVLRLLHPRNDAALTPAAAALILGLDPDGRRRLRRELRIGPLATAGILIPVDDAPHPEQGHRLAEQLWDVLRGIDAWPRGVEVVPVPSASSPRARQIADAAIRSGRCVVLVTGPPSRPETELAAIARAGLTAAAVPSVVVDATTAAEHGCLVSLHATARGVVPIVRGVVAGVVPMAHPGPIVVCAAEPAPLVADERPVVTVALDPAGVGERLAMWQDLVPELNGATERLAGLVRLDQVRASASVADARAAAALGARRLDADDIVVGARRRSDRSLPASVRRVLPDASWDDLVTTPDNEAQLRSIVARMQGQVTVLDRWGFGSSRILPGVRVLLSGPPGTGKTLSAEIIAAALGLELLVVDLAALVSKWIGETEKHIAEVFDAAERSQAVLFFDEADAIFGRRTEAGDAQSRWANLETAYLLGRVDRFDGVVTLATNLRSNIDDAFIRRLDVIVEFDEPGDVERRALWRLHLPEHAPVDPDVDLAALASLYPVTGAVIRNAVLAAAFTAAVEGLAINQDHLLCAIEREYRKAGRTFPGRPRVRRPHVTGGG